MTRDGFSIYFLSAGVWAAYVLHTFQGHWGSDLSALYLAAYSYEQGATDLVYATPSRLFAADTPEAWLPVLETLGHAGEIAHPYLYPPLWAALLAPVTTTVSPQAFFDIVLVFHVFVAAASVPLSFRIAQADALRLSHWSVFAFFLMGATVIGKLAFLQNQVQITVVFLTLLAFDRYRTGHDIAAGMMLGLAVALKLSPLPFALIFLLDRNWRALTALAATGAALGLASLAITGIDLHRVFLTRIGEVGQLVVLSKINYAPEALLYQAAQLLRGEAVMDGFNVQIDTAAKPAWIALSGRVAALVSLAVTALATQGLPFRQALPVRLLAISVTTVLFGPLSWAHAFLMPVLLMPALFQVMSARAAYAWIGVLFITQHYQAYLLLFPLNSHFLVTALVAVLFFLALLVGLLVAAARRVSANR